MSELLLCWRHAVQSSNVFCILFYFRAVRDRCPGAEVLTNQRPQSTGALQGYFVWCSSSRAGTQMALRTQLLKLSIFISCCQCLACHYTALGPWPRVRIQFFRQHLMDRTMMYFQTRSKDECNLTRKACWWRTSCYRDGAAADEIIKEIISRFKDHPSI